MPCGRTTEMRNDVIEDNSGQLRWDKKNTRNVQDKGNAGAPVPRLTLLALGEGSPPECKLKSFDCETTWGSHHSGHFKFGSSCMSSSVSYGRRPFLIFGDIDTALKACTFCGFFRMLLLQLHLRAYESPGAWCPFEVPMVDQKQQIFSGQLSRTSLSSRNNQE